MQHPARWPTQATPGRSAPSSLAPSGYEPPFSSGDTASCKMTGGDTTPCRMTGVTLHGVLFPDPGSIRPELVGALRLRTPPPVLLYRGTSRIRKRNHLGPCRRTNLRDKWWSQGGLRFLMSEVLLQVTSPLSLKGREGHIRPLPQFWKCNPVKNDRRGYNPG